MKKVLVFYGFAYLMTWSFWIPMVLANPQIKYFHLLGTWGPALAAIFLTYYSVGWTGLQKWWKGLFYVSSWKWLAFVILLPFLLYYGSLYFCLLVLHEPVVISSYFYSVEFSELGMLSILTSIIFYGLGEQIGWRGYALPKLIAHGYNNITASFILSVFWSFWHAPLFLYHFSQYSQMSLPLIIGWYLSLLLSSFLLTWIYNSAGKSVLAVAIFHGLIDVIVMTPTQNGATALIIINVFLMFAGFITLLTGTKLSSIQLAAK